MCLHKTKPIYKFILSILHFFAVFSILIWFFFENNNKKQLFIVSFQLVWIVALLATVLLDVAIGLCVAVAFALLTTICRSQRYIIEPNLVCQLRIETSLYI